MLKALKGADWILEPEPITVPTGIGAASAASAASTTAGAAPSAAAGVKTNAFVVNGSTRLYPVVLAGPSVPSVTVELAGFDSEPALAVLHPGADADWIPLQPELGSTQNGGWGGGRLAPKAPVVRVSVPLVAGAGLLRAIPKGESTGAASMRRDQGDV